MPNDLPPLHSHLEFLSPLSGSRADELVRFLASHARGTVVDIGCGWASLLTRLVSECADVHGIGIDSDGGSLEHARSVAERRGIGKRLELIEGRVTDHLPKLSDGAICLGATHAWTDAVEENQPLDYAAALNGLRRSVVRGAPVVYGEAIWSVAPTEAAIAPLAGRMDEFIFLPDLVDLAASCGFVVMQVHEANQDEWDQFESGFAAGYSEWLAGHTPDHPEYTEVMSRSKRQRDAYFRGYRGIMGMAYLCLLAV